MNYRTKSLLIGAAAGALLGAAFAWVSSESDPNDPDAQVGFAKMGPTDYFQLGISILNLARQFGGMINKV
ncbi:MAG: hypothetical protein NT075_03940 [Chloroflexi bacterium]|nr:hypothetical protein [Chloroflexota bacterium]